MAHPFRIPMAARSLRNLVSAPATRPYPLAPRPRPAGARGQVAVDVESCVFCGLCARRCPAQAIAVSREERRFALEQLRCIACGVCVEVCNKDSLSLLPDAPPVHVAGDRPADGGPLGLLVFVKPAPPPKATPASPAPSGPDSPAA